MKLKLASLESVRKFAKATGARGVVVLVFSDDQYGVTSYGRTKKDCQLMKSFTDALAVLLSSGDLPDPWRDNRERLSAARQGMKDWSEYFGKRE